MWLLVVVASGVILMPRPLRRPGLDASALFGLVLTLIALVVCIRGLRRPRSSRPGLTAFCVVLHLGFWALAYGNVDD